ncbi:glucan 1,4-alpha-maltotetraohydrolase domain-containing protein [Lacinutrix sp. Hel_I_90]|uniref:glucan 1,4-alpha-maltotetraohydrolase domain-containing protein n=1 Tax=Lacinutrix sp. Hel_I_90 TaxID=1249999 RepID=UPI0009E5FC04|nr:glucan 1,4-alpha-maltotetraohydrolase domain-containing protein [Lacinutrix sp. Hel_I_90]
MTPFFTHSLKNFSGKILFYCAFFVLYFLQTTTQAQQANDSRVMLQGFYWESAANNPNNWYNIVNGASQEISDIGIDMIWLPPPSDAGSLEGYLPRQLNNFTTNYGSLTAHKNMLNALNNKGIEPIADIVINHRVGTTNYADFTNPQWNTDAVTSNDEMWSVPEFFNVYPRGNNDTGTPYEAARDIDHTKQYVQNSIIQFLNNLKTLGYKGWRYDFVHGFDEYYFTLYNNATNPTFSVGENYTANKQVIQDWIDATGSTAFDFPTYFTLKSVIRDNNYSYLSNNGSASGGIGWDPRNNTTFVENHDTPRYDTPNNVLNAGNVSQAYAYLLTHSGVPCIYWPHLFDWGTSVKTEITDLVAIRKAAGIHSQSNVSIKASQNGLYAAVISGDNYEVAMKMGPNNWNPQGSGWNLVASGNNYAVWTKATVIPPNTDSFTVFVQNYSTIYSWDDNQNATNENWPGTTLTNLGNGWSSATIPGNCSNIIFSNNGSNQTANLNTCSDLPYYYQGNWYASDPTNNTGSGSFTVYVQGYSNVYSWDNNQQATSGNWPGTTLSSAGNGYVSATISGNCSNIIFSNNGGNQTPDLYTCSDKPYYYNNSWHSNPVNAKQAIETPLSLVKGKGFSIFPNPATHSFSVSFTESKILNLELYNIQGQRVLSENNLQKERHHINVESYPRGLYLIKLQLEDDSTQIKKIILE